jgi:hypothetical protein
MIAEILYILRKGYVEVIYHYYFDGLLSATHQSSGHLKNSFLVFWFAESKPKETGDF